MPDEEAQKFEMNVSTRGIKVQRVFTNGKTVHEHEFVRGDDVFVVFGPNEQSVRNYAEGLGSRKEPIVFPVVLGEIDQVDWKSGTTQSRTVEALNHNAVAELNVEIQ